MGTNYNGPDAKLVSELRRAFFAGAACTLDQIFKSRYVRAAVRHMTDEIEDQITQENIEYLMTVEPAGEA